MLLKTFSIGFLLIALFHATSAGTAEERISFSVPAAPWTLTLPKEGLVVQEQQEPRERRVYLHARLHADSGVLPSVEVRVLDATCDLIGEGGFEEVGNEEAMSVPELVPKASELVAGRGAELLGR